LPRLRSRIAGLAAGLYLVRDDGDGGDAEGARAPRPTRRFRPPTLARRAPPPHADRLAGLAVWRRSVNDAAADGRDLPGQLPRRRASASARSRQRPRPPAVSARFCYPAPPPRPLSPAPPPPPPRPRRPSSTSSRPPFSSWRRAWR
jgi:hypothetical protein